MLQTQACVLSIFVNLYPLCSQPFQMLTRNAEITFKGTSQITKRSLNVFSRHLVASRRSHSSSYLGVPSWLTSSREESSEKSMQDSVDRHPLHCCDQLLSAQPHHLQHSFMPQYNHLQHSQYSTTAGHTLVHLYQLSQNFSLGTVLHVQLQRN